MKRLLFTVLVLLSHQAYAAPYHYLTTPISPELLPAPPTDDSRIKQEETRIIIGLQEHPDAKELEAAKHEHHLNKQLVSEGIIKDFTPLRYPASYKLLTQAGEDCGQASREAKGFWHTMRPYLAGKGVKALVEKPNTEGSYPSGHAQCSRLWAEVLGQIFPEHRKELRERAREIGQHRVLVGMHYPHDISGGQTMAMLILGGMQQNAAFRADLDAARKEATAP